MGMDRNQSREKIRISLTIFGAFLAHRFLSIILLINKYQSKAITQESIIKMIAPKDEQIEALLGERALKAPTIACGKGHQIKRFCSNAECKYDSFCCDEDDCDLCQSQHETCSSRKLVQLTKFAEERLFLRGRILRRLFAIENQLMSQLMATRKEIVQKSEEWMLGVNSEIIDSIYFKNSIKGIKGKEMNKLFSELSEKQMIEEQAEEYLSSYQAEGEQMVAKFEKLRGELLQNLAQNKEKQYQKEIGYQKKPKIASKEQKAQIYSNILTEDKEGSQKCSFLLKQLNSPQLKLLFRASQHGFSASKFHQFCDGISDTVTIVRTEFGRTIAAYTPLKWSSANVNGEWAADYSERSFLLQLELREKMALKQPQKAILNHPYRGPTFGGGGDLQIADQCNQNQNSYSYFPHSYNCNGKYHFNQQSWTAFCGSPKGYRFRVVEYEVFVVSK